MSTTDSIIPFVTAPTLFGLWDTHGRCWIGNDKGPVTYDAETLARLAATVATERLQSPGWVMAKLFTGHGPKRDEIETPFTTTEAIQRLEVRWFKTTPKDSNE